MQNETSRQNRFLLFKVIVSDFADMVKTLYSDVLEWGYFIIPNILVAVTKINEERRSWLSSDLSSTCSFSICIDRLNTSFFLFILFRYIQRFQLIKHFPIFNVSSIKLVLKLVSEKELISHSIIRKMGSFFMPFRLF